MRIRVFAAGSNVSIDRPVKSMSKDHVDWKVGVGSLVWISKTAAQFVKDRELYVAPPVQAKPRQFADCSGVNNRRNWSWKKRFSGPVEVLQLVP